MVTVGFQQQYLQVETLCVKIAMQHSDNIQ